MIRALIGRFVMGCLDAAAAETQRAALVQEVHLDRMTDDEVSRWLAGHRLPAGHPALVPLTARRRWRRA